MNKIILIGLFLSVITVELKSIQREKAAGNAEPKARQLDQGPATLESRNENGEEQVLQKVLRIRQAVHEANLVDDAKSNKVDRQSGDPVKIDYSEKQTNPWLLQIKAKKKEIKAKMADEDEEDEAKSEEQQDDKENQGDVEKQDEKESSNKFLATKFGEKMLDNLEEALNAYRQNDNKRAKAFPAVLWGATLLVAGLGAMAEYAEGWTKHNLTDASKNCNIRDVAPKSEPL